MSILRMYNTESIDREVRYIETPPPNGEHIENPGSYLSNDQILNVLGDGQEFSTTNKLILTLTPAQDEANIFDIFDTQVNPAFVIQHVSLFFKDTVPSPTGFERDCYSQVVTGDVLITLDAFRAEIEIPFADLVKDNFERKGLPIPEFGFMSMIIKSRKFDSLTNTPGLFNEQTVIIKITLEPLVRPIEFFVPPQRGELAEVVNWFTSKPFAYENLHIPSITGSFKYNYFEVNEGSLLAAKRKNFNLMKISEIPKYIELNWTPAPLTVAGGVAQANPNEQQPNPDGVQQQNGDVVGGRFQAEGAAQIANGFRIGGMGGGVIIAIGGAAEEAGALFGGRGGVGRMARGIRRGTLQNVDANDGVGPDPIIGQDNTISLGLSEQEDLILQDLVRNTDQPDSISGPNEFSRYIGYVLLKERYNPTLDKYEAVDLLAVLDRRKNRIIDTKVAYGDIYRYKIRSVFKFINSSELPLFGDQDTILSRSVVSTFDGGIPFKNAFYFDSKFSEPIEVSCVEFHRPDAPYNVQIFPNSKKKEIFITWNQKNPNKDVAGFNIFRKLDKPNARFERITNLSLANRSNFFIDNLVDFDTNYIYAIQSVDIHDNFSKLSVQYKVSIKSQDFWVERVENKIQVHTNDELELNERETSRDDNEVIKFNDSVKLIINPLFGNLDREATYLLKIKSLDTFLEKEVKLNFRTKIITHRSILQSDVKFTERQAQIQKEFEEAERKRFGLTIQEAQRRKDTLTPGRDEFEE